MVLQLWPCMISSILTPPPPPRRWHFGIYIFPFDQRFRVRAMGQHGRRLSPSIGFSILSRQTPLGVYARTISLGMYLCVGVLTLRSAVTFLVFHIESDIWTVPSIASHMLLYIGQSSVIPPRHTEHAIYSRGANRFKGAHRKYSRVRVLILGRCRSSPRSPVVS